MQSLLRLLLCLAVLVLPLRGQSLAITLDDGPALDPTPHLSAAARNEALLKAFKAKGVQVGLFVNGIHGGDTPEGRRWLETWGRQGHLLGNHTYRHTNLDRVGQAAYREDFRKGDAFVRTLPGFAPFFRFTYLKEGADPARRDGMRQELAKAGYRNAHVTISTFDWLVDERLRAALKDKPNLDLAPYRTFYLQHLHKLARHYQELGLLVTGREIPHVLLLHHNLLNALLMEDVLETFQKNGWKLLSPREAYQDPIYAREPRTLATGESFLWQLAMEGHREGPVLTRLEQFYEAEKALMQELGL